MSDKFDPTKPVRTRDGRKARIICTNRVGTVYDRPIIALLDFDTHEEVRTFTGTGRFRATHTSNDDLVNIPTTQWVNLDQEEVGRTVHNAFYYTSKEKADAHAGKTRIACVEIEV